MPKYLLSRYSFMNILIYYVLYDPFPFTRVLIFKTNLYSWAVHIYVYIYNQKYTKSLGNFSFRDDLTNFYNILAIGEFGLDSAWLLKTQIIVTRSPARIG